MAWDDAPPNAEELGTLTAKAPSPTSWDSAPPTKEEMEGPSLGGFAKNLGSDIVGTAKGLGKAGMQLAKFEAQTIPHYAQTAQQMVQGKPFTETPTFEDLKTTGQTALNLGKGLVQEGKRIGVGELLTGHPINAVGKLAGAFYDKPLTTALDVAPAVGTVGKALGFGGKAARGAEMAAQAGNVGEDLAQTGRIGAGMAENLAGTAKTAAPEAAQAIPTGATFGETVQNLTQRIPGSVKAPLKQVGEALEGKYGQIAAKRPGFAETMADYMKEHAQNMALKDIGAAPGQIRKIGVDRAHELADYAFENGLVGPKIGTIGRNKMVASRLDEAGGAVGGFRKMATDRGAKLNMDELTNQIREKLDQKYLQGMYSGQKGQYMKGLIEVKRTAGTPQEIADKITEMFSEAKRADPLRQPAGPLADIARELRAANHQQISKTLTPSEMNLYERSLEDYGALKQIHEFVKRRESVEAGGRLGPGAGISRMAVQKFLDSVGYRAEAKIANKLSNFIRQNPEVATKPRELFRHYIDEAAEAVDELGEVPR